MFETSALRYLYMFLGVRTGRFVKIVFIFVGTIFFIPRNDRSLSIRAFVFSRFSSSSSYNVSDFSYIFGVRYWLTI